MTRHLRLARLAYVELYRTPATARWRRPVEVRLVTALPRARMIVAHVGPVSLLVGGPGTARVMA